MELSSEITSGLQAAQSIKSELFEKYIENIFAVILRQKDESVFRSKEYESLDKLVFKQSYAGLVGFILEGGKANADPILMRTVLSESIRDGTKVDYFIEQYTNRKSELLTLLATTGFNFPNIVDVQWRLDFLMKSQSVEKENTPIYLLKLDTQTPGKIPLGDQSASTESVEFTCNGWELLDLVQKLRDAAKQFERITGAQ